MSADIGDRDMSEARSQLQMCPVECEDQQAGRTRQWMH